MVCSKIKDILEPIMDSDRRQRQEKKGHYGIDVPYKRRVGIPPSTGTWINNRCTTLMSICMLI